MKSLRGLFQAKKSTIQDEIIIVSGLPRSGTSMMMQMLAAGGIEPLTDQFRIADKSNPNGYYEFEGVKKLKEGDMEWLSKAQGKSVKVITALLEYLPKGYHYKILFMRRKMNEILASQHQMLVREGKEGGEADDQTMADIFDRHLQQVTLWLAGQPHMDVLYLSYNELLTSPDASLEELDRFLGRRLDRGAMKAMIDPTLYREKA